MSASNLLSQDKPAMDRKAYEPSMEEILASIRRIIADDQAFTLGPAALEDHAQPAAIPAPTQAASSNAMYGQPADAAEASRWQAEAALAPPAYNAEAARGFGPQMEPNGQIEAQLTHAASDPRVPRVARQPATPAPVQAVAGQGQGQSHAYAEHGRNGVDIAQRPAAQIGDALFSSTTDQTVAGAFNALLASRFVQSQDAISDIVRDIVRPLLKAWLDENLPLMVERMVRAEIDRVARGGR